MVIPPLGESSLGIRFSPAELGSRYATLSIFSNAPYDSVLAVPIYGIGNTPPVFAGYTVSTAEGEIASILRSTILDLISDADGDAVMISTVGPYSMAGAQVQYLGSMNYMPLPGYRGVDTFPLAFMDSKGAYVTGIVTVIIGPLPEEVLQGANGPRLAKADGNLQLRFKTIPGAKFQVQRSSNALNHWVTMATAIAGPAGDVSWTDEDPPEGSAFYRLHQP